MEISFRSALLSTLRETNYAIVKVVLRHTLYYMALPVLALSVLYSTVMATVFNFGPFYINGLTYVIAMFSMTVVCDQAVRYNRTGLFSSPIDVVLRAIVRCIVCVGLLCMIVIIVQVNRYLDRATMADLAGLISLSLMCGVMWTLLASLVQVLPGARPSPRAHEGEYVKLCTAFEEKFNALRNTPHS